MRLGDVGNEPKAMTGRKIEKEHTVDMRLQSVRCGVLFTGLCVSGGDQFGRSARCPGTTLRVCDKDSYKDRLGAGEGRSRDCSYGLWAAVFLTLVRVAKEAMVLVVLLELPSPHSHRSASGEGGEECRTGSLSIRDMVPLGFFPGSVLLVTEEK
ncbi:hypothetical protein L6452_05030 [Arctium lappa]|uniref:Uncharacterized protein n=1 Tax=Arctium lappa TaxID=4217 RepID=A0ACB9EFJ6_ARCLA|nr:hypothetical protein L6452_05030 [Arctium lappa]